MNKILLPALVYVFFVSTAQAVDYQKAYESVDKEKATDSVDVNKARDAFGY